MSDEQDETMALVPVAETLPDDISQLPVLDWRNVQRSVWAFQDNMAALKPHITRLLRDLGQWWQQSGLADISAALVEQEHIEQRQRITAAKQRARIVTRAKGNQRPRKRGGNGGGKGWTA